MIDGTLIAAAPLVTVDHLTVRFVTREVTVHAVNGVSFSVRPGETLCILDESGSGKSVMLRALMRLLPRGRGQITGGLAVDGRDVLASPKHPYTQGLLASTVHGGHHDQDIQAIPGNPPDLWRLPSGCAFGPRCSQAMAACRTTVPEPRHPAPGRVASCLQVGGNRDVATARMAPLLKQHSSIGFQGQLPLVGSRGEAPAFLTPLAQPAPAPASRRRPAGPRRRRRCPRWRAPTPRPGK